MDERSAWLEGGDSDPAVVAGNGEASLLTRAVRYDAPDLQMPPSQALPAAEIALLKQWVRTGAPAPQRNPPTSA